MPHALPLTILLLAAIAPLPASAADAPVAGTLYQLSPQEVNAIKARAAERGDAPAVQVDAIDVPDVPSPKRQVHGEVGFGIGTNGYRSVFGTVVYPLGDDGFAAFSFENSDFGNNNRRFRRR